MTKFETIYIETDQVACDGGGGPLGHPRVYLHIDSNSGHIVCPYCSRDYVLETGAKKTAAH